MNNNGNPLIPTMAFGEWAKIIMKREARKVSVGCGREWEFEFLWAEAERIFEWLCWPCEGGTFLHMPKAEGAR